MEYGKASQDRKKNILCFTFLPKNSLRSLAEGAKAQATILDYNLLSKPAEV